MMAAQWHGGVGTIRGDGGLPEKEELNFCTSSQTSDQTITHNLDVKLVKKEFPLNKGTSVKLASSVT